MKNNALGRGLDALFSEVIPRPSVNEVAQVAIGDIDPNREQPRKSFDPQALQQLADSIAHSGVLQPILLIRSGERYQILAGERRWRAARMAGLDTIPSLIREVDQISRIEIALIENIQRENLNPIEEAAAIRALMDECGLTQDAVSKRLGRSRPAIANLVRLLTLPQQIQEMVQDGRLTAGHARALAAVENRTRQLQLALSTIEGEWSVRQLEAEAAKKSPAEHPARPVRLPPAEFQDIEERARMALGMRVSVKGSLSKGKIILSYGDQAELENFLSILEEMQNAV
ncbi:MAG: ParB/RepB/Spo0J family partition protein [Oscillospiraceae bacterium]|jgi:ParB family chromosome partitioning protein|nr:ParB/RepB/Spo0J family partition protein [Oscillospiraceae bacterium]